MSPDMFKHVPAQKNDNCVFSCQDPTCFEIVLLLRHADAKIELAMLVYQLVMSFCSKYCILSEFLNLIHFKLIEVDLEYGPDLCADHTAGCATIDYICV
jgi:hypothetical protein